MKIEEIETSDDCWIALLEDFIKRDDRATLIPTSAMSQNVAITLAVKMKVSLQVEGDRYVFSRAQEGTLVQMGEEIVWH